MSISTRLDQAMREAGFGGNQSALSRASGVPQPTINRILKNLGKRGPETETIKKLALACSVSFIWLMEGKGDKKRIATGHATTEIDSVLKLIELYRNATPEGRQDILTFARSVRSAVSIDDIGLDEAQ